MSESSSDTESSCGWTVISNEGSDIETLGPENMVDDDLDKPGAAPVPDQPDSPPEGESSESVEESGLDATRREEETVLETEPDPQAGNGSSPEERVTICSSSDHSDIVTLADSGEAELGTWAEPVAIEQKEETGNEELHMGSSTSSKYTFSAAETISEFPAERPVHRGLSSSSSSSSSTEDEDAETKAGPPVRRRRPRRTTVESETEKQQEEGDEDLEEVEEQREAHLTHQHQNCGTLNKCILLALVIALSMGFGHFYGTVQVQEKHRMVEKSRINGLNEAGDAMSKIVVKSLRGSLREERQDVVTSLTGVIDQITKENQRLRAKDAELQAQRRDLLSQLQQTKSETENRHKNLASENRALRSTLEREEASLSAMQDEHGRLRAQIRELQQKGSGADSVLSENQRLKGHLLEEKQRIRTYLSQKEALTVEAQALRKELEKEKAATEKLKEELEMVSQRHSGVEGEAEVDSETEELQARLQELEKKLSFEQQRSDLWERLYVESKEKRAKGDNQAKSTKSKDGLMETVTETFDAVKNSTKEFVHHHKEQIKKAKEAVKENLRKFSDSVKSTFRHLKDSTSNVLNRMRRPQEMRFNERKDAKAEQQELPRKQEFRRNVKSHWQHHQPLHQSARRSTADSSFQADCNTRKHDTQKEQPSAGQKTGPKGCAGVFDCAYQESMSLFNKAAEPIRADEFHQLLRSYLQREVGHFHHWRELNSFINNFFRNGLFIHDQMLFTDFVSGVEDYLEDMDEYQSGDEDVFEDLDDFIYRHFFGDTYAERYGPSWVYTECSERAGHRHQCDWESSV